jgi:hypothetical protein
MLFQLMKLDRFDGDYPLIPANGMQYTSEDAALADAKTLASKIGDVIEIVNVYSFRTIHFVHP